LPGPLIKTRVGDRLIVHFKNELDQPTTVHWHGVRVPIEMDGVPEISQPEVKKGESFTYDFVVRDAGLYWYHPHVMSAASPPTAADRRAWCSGAKATTCSRTVAAGRP
jgi:FtsP/CotA-like multicopper oxidase with cupredoxin domain